MYHSTKTCEQVEGILDNGFKLSSRHENMLGEGIYVSATLEKAICYGDFTMKLLVYTGRTCKVDEQGHPKQKSWQTDYGCAWVPPNCRMVPSGRQVLLQFQIFTFMVGYGSLAGGLNNMNMRFRNPPISYTRTPKRTSKITES